jgi:hypothetical protein
MDQVDGQWKQWCDFVMNQPASVYLAGTSIGQLRDERQRVSAPTTHGDWLGWPSGPHITTVHLVNFLSQLTSQKDGKSVAYSTFRSYKAHLLEILLKTGSLRDYYNDPAAKMILDSLTDEKRRSETSASKYNGDHFEMDQMFEFLKSDKGRFNKEKKIKLRRERSVTVIRMHSLARSDDIAKMKIGSLLRGKDSQDSSSSHWVYEDRENVDQPSAVVLFVPEAKTDSPMIKLGATPEEPHLCPIRELKEHCAWLKTLPADEIKDDALFLSAKPQVVGYDLQGKAISKYKSLAASTVAIDVLNTMKLSGIDTDKWKAHALRGAAASRMYEAGLELEVICELGRWAHASTFEKYYKRHKRPSTFAAATALVGGWGQSYRNEPPSPFVHLTGVEIEGSGEPGAQDFSLTGDGKEKPDFTEPTKVKCMDPNGVNTSRPVPEATEGGNAMSRHCWSCNRLDARMIHCDNCNKHLHRSHFGDNKSEHALAEANFLQQGWTCEECEVATSWSSYNIKTTDTAKIRALREHSLWRVGSLGKRQKETVEDMMK